MQEENLAAKPKTDKYSLIAMLLHWLLAMGLAGVFAAGFFMADLPVSPLKLKLFNWHKWAGIIVLTLTVLRLVWRITHQPPPLPAHIQQRMPAWQQLVHQGTQYSMYALFFIVPFVGWAYSSASGYPVVVFGVLPLPDFVTADKVLAELIKPWHEISAFALAGLVGLHVAAALKHQFVDKHAMLQRILPVRHS